MSKNYILYKDNLVGKYYDIISIIIKGDNKMIGIYKITNKINNHSYIGLSTHIEDRWNYHKTAYNWNREKSKILYKAFQKYGIENFYFEVLEECPISELCEKEQYYIDKYDTYKNGYNMTSGGESPVGENHPRHKLTKEDIIDIRTRYDNLERKNIVYNLYKDRIGESGFSKIWKGETWKTIKMEVYTPENKEYHSHNTANKGSKNGRSKLTEEDVKIIRLRKKYGESLSEVYKDYQDRLTKGSFTNVWSYQNWKEIVV